MRARILWLLALLLYFDYSTSFLCTHFPKQVRLKVALQYDYFATTVDGLEKVLADEIVALPDVVSVEPSKCGVHFSGSKRTGLSGIMNLRTSLKLMELIGDHDHIATKDDLVRFVDDIDWSLMIDTNETVKVDTVQGLNLPPDLTHSFFTSLTVKNAIVDQFRLRFGDRPGVSLDNAGLPLVLYLHRSTASLYRVWSGCSSMHKRGYREDLTVHKAALRETTAAAM